MKENRWSTTQFDRPPMTKPRTLEEIAHGLWVRDEIGALSEEQFLAALREAADAARREEREALRKHWLIPDRLCLSCTEHVAEWLDARSRAEEPR